MEKQIKDFLHLYIGCDFMRHDGRVLTLTGYDTNTVRLNHATYPTVFLEKGSAKPILRPLSSLSEKERNIADEILNVFEGNNVIDAFQGMANMTMFLLSKHFDLFDLIDAGLAIDKTTLK